MTLITVLYWTCDSSDWTKWLSGFYPGSADLVPGIFKEKECKLKNVSDFDQWVLFPVDTFTNYPYLFIGLGFVALGLRDFMLREQIAKAKMTNPMRKQPEWQICLGCMIVFLSIFSFVYHASMRKIGSRLDRILGTSILIYLSQYVLYSFCIEDINRRFVIGKKLGRLVVYCSFFSSIFLGFLLNYVRTKSMYFFY